jgi:hypothetical protein
MKLIISTFWVFLLSIGVYGQKVDDTKIIITLSDSSQLYKKTKIALVDLDFIVKDNYNYDTLTTYPREMHKFPGFVISRAIISGNQIIIFGHYGLTQIDDFGYSVSPSNYKPITYYKGSYSWKLLMAVAEKLGGQVTFAK